MIIVIAKYIMTPKSPPKWFQDSKSCQNWPYSADWIAADFNMCNIYIYIYSYILNYLIFKYTAILRTPANVISLND